MEQYLKGKVALITGSGQGIGKGIATYFAKQGAVVITNNRSKHAKESTIPPEGLNEAEREQWLKLSGDAETVAENIRQNGGTAEAYYCDVSDFEAVEKMFAYVKEKFGRIDIVVNNAAITQSGSLLSLMERDWDKQTIVKMKGAFNCMRHCVPLMIEQGGGCILNCSSDSWVGLGSAAAYSAANAGIVGLTKACAAELHRYGITCNAFCPQAESPGHVAGFSKMLRTLSAVFGQEVHMDPEKKAEVDRAHGNAENIAPLLAFLATPQAKKITGLVFSVTAAGKIELYSEPVLYSKIEKEDSAWSVEELAKAVPEVLLKNCNIPSQSELF